MGSVVRDTALRRFLIWSIISAAFTALVVQFSYAHGKLSCPPFYDDVAYFEDALHRLEVFHSSGMGALIVDYVNSPPHSAFSSFLAAGAFAVFGVFDWAPYVANGLVIFALVAFLDFLCRDLSQWRRLAVMFIVLCVPISAMAVHEFRPDIPSALSAAMGTAMLLWRSLTQTSWRYRVMAGGLFGSAALFKPPTSPLTVIVFVAAIGMAVVVDLIMLRPDSRKMLIAIAQCCAAAVLVPLPHFLIDGRDTYGYIYQNIFGPSHSTWARQGSVLWHLRYYIDGPGGAAMFGGMLGPLVIATVVGLIAFAALRFREQALRLIGLTIVAAVAYAVPAVMDVKEPFFGTTFSWILAFAAIFVVADLLRRPGWLPVATVLVFCAVSLRAARLGPNLVQRGSAVVLERNRLVHDIYAALYNEHFPFYSRVYLTTTGYVNPGVLDYYFRRDTLHAMNIDANSFSDDLGTHAREVASADYVIASESGNGVAYADFVKSGLVQDQTLAIVRGNADFQQIGAYPTLTGKCYFLFRRVNPFCGWISPIGLTPLVPAEKGQRVTHYIATGPSINLVIPANGPSRLRLAARIQSSISPLEVHFKVDGRGNRERFFNEAGKIQELTFALTLRGGGEHSVELLFDPPATEPNPITFSQLEIIPDEQK
jgi:hypothetical protein